jgi:Domain of unknown function (DUF4328)
MRHRGPMARRERDAPVLASPRRFRSLGGLEGCLVCALILSVLMLQFVNDWLNLDLATLRDRQAGLPVAESEIARNHRHLLMFGRAAIVMLGITAVLWLIWQVRAHTNLRTLGGSRPWFGPGRGLLAWVLPGPNLVLVPLALSELWVKSDPWEGTPDRAPRWSVLVVIVWWGFTLALLGLVTAALAHQSLAAGAPGGLIARDQLLKDASFVSIGAAAMAAATVVLIDSRLEGKDARVGSPPSASRWRQG